MRAISFLILLLIVVAVGLFAWQNNEEVTLRFLDRSTTQPLSLFSGAVYLLGMVSGWSVVGILKRSVKRVTERSAG
jgi:uncharacterized membrane protein YciS (DUF1049 family)